MKRCLYCKKCKTLIICLSFNILFLLMATSNGSDEFGVHSPNSPQFAAIDKVITSSDRIITYDAESDKFDIGLGRRFNNAKRPLLFDLEEISAFLENEKHKSLLVIWFGLSDDEKRTKKLAVAIVGKLKAFKYSRIVVLGHAGNGINYIFDTKQNGLKSKPSSPTNSEGRHKPQRK